MSDDPERDRIHIRNPAGWKLGNVLPMKNWAKRDSQGMPTQGCLILGRGLTRVHHVPFTDLVEATASSKAVNRLPQTEYPTIDAMLAAGWRVD